MRSAITGFNALQGNQLREDELQQSGTVQVYQPFGRDGRQQYLVQLICNALPGYDRDALLVAAQRLEGVIVDIEIQLGGKADATHHTQGIVTEGNVRIERRADVFFTHVLHSSERIHQLSITLPVEADRQGIDSEVPAVLVVLQRTVFHNRLARIVRVGLLAGAHKLHFRTMILQLRRTEILENRKVCTTPQAFGKRLRHCNAAAHHYHINIFGRALQENVAHVAAYHVTFQSQFICRLGNSSEYIVTETLFQLFCCQFNHI